MADQPEKLRVKMVRSDYQPTKVEQEEVIDLRNPDGSKPTPEELAQATLRPMDIEWTDRPE